MAFLSRLALGARADAGFDATSTRPNFTSAGAVELYSLAIRVALAKRLACAQGRQALGCKTEFQQVIHL